MRAVAVRETRPAVRALVGLGSNLDDPEQQIRRALEALGTLAATRLVRASRLFRSAPWGVTAQPSFINAVAELTTRLPPRALLAALLALEHAHGRRRDGSRWGPRTLDLDLLTWGDLQLDEPGLTLPHPHMAERAFVLMPLAELDADRVIPGRGTVCALLAGVDTSQCEAIGP